MVHAVGIAEQAHVRCAKSLHSLRCTFCTRRRGYGIFEKAVMAVAMRAPVVGKMVVGLTRGTVSLNRFIHSTYTCGRTD